MIGCIVFAVLNAVLGWYGIHHGAPTLCFLCSVVCGLNIGAVVVDIGRRI